MQTVHKIAAVHISIASPSAGRPLLELDSHGLALTKGTELKLGKLTAWLAGGKEVDAELIDLDEENDVALVKVHATVVAVLGTVNDPSAAGVTPLAHDRVEV